MIFSFHTIMKYTFLNQPTLQMASQEEQDTILEERCIIIDSRDRDRTKWPNTNEFQIKIRGSDQDVGVVDYECRNIRSIELMKCVVPSNVTNGTTGVPYLILEIPELDNLYHGTNTHLENMFGFLSPQDAIGTKFIGCKYENLCKRIYEPALGSLGQMTIRIRRPNGTFFDFGTDTSPPTDVDDDVQVMLIFRIVAIRPNRAHLRPQLI
jgi:hypothetical protein